MNKPPTRKRRTREHVIADLSVNFVERQMLLCGHTVERVFHDYGYDLFSFTFDANGEPEAGDIRIQVKATDKLPGSGKGGGIPFRVDRSDVVYWLTERSPVVLVLYDARQEAAYWLDIKDYFRRLVGFNLFSAGKTITVHLPQTNVFDLNAVRHLAAAKNREREDQE